MRFKLVEYLLEAENIAVLDPDSEAASKEENIVYVVQFILGKGKNNFYIPCSSFKRLPQFIYHQLKINCKGYVDCKIFTLQFDEEERKFIDKESCITILASTLKKYRKNPNQLPDLSRLTYKVDNPISLEAKFERYNNRGV